MTRRKLRQPQPRPRGPRRRVSNFYFMSQPKNDNRFLWILIGVGVLLLLLQVAR